MRLALICLDLAKADRPHGHSDLACSGEIHKGQPDEVQGFGLGGEGRFSALPVNGLGEEDQGFGEAFKKFERVAMNLSVWSRSHFTPGF